MGENTWTHIGIVAVPMLMLLGFWIDTRRSNEQRKRSDEVRHQQNSEKLARLETMMEPMWKWFNNGRSKD